MSIHHLIRSAGAGALVTSMLALGLFSTSAHAAQAQGKPQGGAQEQAAKKEWKGDPYLLATDAVTGKPLGPIEKQVILQHEGREFRFASNENAEEFKANPQKYVPAVDEKIVHQQLSLYPLDVCLVSGDKLGTDAVSLVYKNRLVRFSSKEHQQTFLKDPATYVAKLDQAVIAKQGPGMTAKTCPVSGEELGGDMGKPIDYVIGNQLVRLCCKGCLNKIEKDPLKYLKTADAAGKGEHEKSGEPHDGHGKDQPH